MRKQNQTNALLVELLIVILFFMLGSVILIQVFSSSYKMSKKADVLAQAMAEAQNVADTLYRSGDMEETLGKLGFEKSSNEDEASLTGWGGEETSAGTDLAAAVWSREADGYLLRVTLSGEKLERGAVKHLQVQAVTKEEVLITLPRSRYEAEALQG